MNESFEARKNRTTDVLTQLRYEIISGKLENGAYLRENSLSERMNTSRGPVRSALQQLVAEGLAVTEKNGTTRVNGISEKDVNDLYQIRLLLEKKAVAILREMEYVDYTPLLSCLNDLKKERDKGSESDPKTMAALGFQVHVAIMKCTENKALFRAWKSQADLLYSIMLINGSVVDSEWAYQSHQQLVDAIIQKRQDMEQVIEEHLGKDSKDIFLKHYVSERANSEI